MTGDSARQLGDLVEHARAARALSGRPAPAARYHFLAPEGVCHPFDPQTCIFWNGRYHLFYAVQAKRIGLWGHASSTDLLPAEVLRIDTSRSSLSRNIVQPWPQPSASFLPDPLDGRADVRMQEAPFALRPGGSLDLRIFLDRSVLEVFANGRQCMAQRIYPTRGDSAGIALFSRGGAATVRHLRAWDLAATSPW